MLQDEGEFGSTIRGGSSQHWFFEMLAEVPLLEGSGEETGKSGKRQRMD